MEVVFLGNGDSYVRGVNQTVSKLVYYMKISFAFN